MLNVEWYLGKSEGS